MNTIRLTVTGIILLAFTLNIIGSAQEDRSPDELVDDIEEYNGSIGPDNALYGLKLAFEGLDESFTLNTTEKLEKKIYHSRLRISEAKTELKKKNDEGAKKAFENYEEKIKETEDSIAEERDNDSGMLNAQKMITKHQYILERLLELHPNNSGLLNAYNNSIELENIFEEKTDRKLERILTKEGRHYLKAVKKENREDRDVREDREDNDLQEFKYELKLEASPIDNNTQVKIELKFMSNKTDNDSIADEIIKELRLSKENISSAIEIDDSYDNELNSILEAQASVGSNISNIKVEYNFLLNETNRTEMIDSIHNKLSDLTPKQILSVLEIKTLQEEIRSEENNNGLDENDSKVQENDSELQGNDSDNVPEQGSDRNDKMDDDKYGKTRQEEDNKRDD
ncbi:MAG: hypothetical protein C3F06_03520 [Candidatus Methanoperedenaceae archaeon]|nr:MAG: hypothetical protein C3F06_03520 [Candidatus Methanoperedenaceae archaeon]